MALGNLGGYGSPGGLGSPGLEMCRPAGVTVLVHRALSLEKGTESRLSSEPAAGFPLNSKQVNHNHSSFSQVN